MHPVSRVTPRILTLECGAYSTCEIWPWVVVSNHYSASLESRHNMDTALNHNRGLFLMALSNLDRN